MPSELTDDERFIQNLQHVQFVVDSLGLIETTQSIKPTEFCLAAFFCPNAQHLANIPGKPKIYILCMP